MKLTDFSGNLVVAMVSDLFDKTTKKEGIDDESPLANNKILLVVKYIVSIVILIAALYSSFKCNNGFKVGPVLLACCCPPCYLAYALAKGCNY